MKLLQLCEKTINDVKASEAKRVHVMITGDVADAVVCYVLNQCNITVVGHVIVSTWFHPLSDQEMATDIQTTLTDSGEWIQPNVDPVISRLDLLNHEGEFEDKSPENLIRVHRIGKRFSSILLDGLANHEPIVGTMDKTRRIFGLSVSDDELTYSPIRSLSRSVIYRLALEIGSSLSKTLTLSTSLFKRIIARPCREDELMLNLIFNEAQRTVSHVQLINTIDRYINFAIEKQETNKKITDLVRARGALIRWRSA
jgi:hypothetical protein